MKEIDIENWERKQHFNFFKDLDYPYFNITGNLDITSFHRYIKEENLPFFIAVLYATTRTANDIPEFRHRIRGSQVIEHNIVSPSFTVMSEQNLFSICSATYVPDFGMFSRNAAQIIADAKERACLETEAKRDDLIYMTCIPWVSFTSVAHPVHLHPVDSIPRIAWGKFFKENGQVKMPLSIQGHHALMDGYHVGYYFELIQKLLDQPDHYL